MYEATYRIWSVERGDWCNQEAVGVSHYVDAIARLYARHGLRSGELRLDLSLIPEPGNPNDPNAVSVQADGYVIGYVPREVAPAWGAPLRRINGSNLTAITPGRIYCYEATEWPDNDWAGGPTKVLHARVDLKLPDAASAIPLNAPPNEPYTLVPRSGIVQVTKESDHFAALSKVVASSGHCLVFATLRRATVTTARTVKEVVAVHIDGEKVGELTPQMSSRFLPMIDHLRERGLTTACWADVTGSAVAAEVRIDAVKAHEATAAVLEGPPVTVPDLVPGFVADWWQSIMTPRHARRRSG